MESNIKGLVAAGHEMASELKAECGAVDMRSVAKLISDLATQLEVQLVRANALSEDHQKAIESIKQADAAVKLAHEKFSALAAENAAMHETIEAVRSVADNSSGIAGWHLNGDIATWEEILPEINDIETPATDAFLAEVRASELDSLAGMAETMLVKFSNQQCSSDMHGVVGWKMVLQQASNRADQLRKGGSQ
ncbi:hypothetical protein DF260_002991 [Escherichia coli O32]|jgi:hypothetical protein|uniref:hypothetical protein n=1 Tax=Escherichia coli TaxID=562 RepID=UPI0015D721B7|nr:hypothetical protein [Escherichia coli]EEZ9623606.1 hypothetical protein [Escherichia coli O32]EGK3657571.1 hypothetical protein [Escherichia coli]EID7571178.1 hypothetical protein [Escherichia coli]MCX1419387.1 hypothetical protein [Escherichia coli]WEY78636.1 hypothetical protein P5707_07915 [Escherichia coli]